MGLLDFDDNYKKPYTPPKNVGKRFRKETALSQEERDNDLNNVDRKENSEDFSDSPFADRI